MSTKDILKLAHLCQYAYKEPLELLNIIKATSCHTTSALLQTGIFISNKNTDAQTYIFYDNTTIYVCFRGTSSTKDKLIDLKVSMTRFLQKDVFIHKGFSKQYTCISQDIKDQISNIQQTHKQTNIVCCGHSLGGALATICSVDLKFSAFASSNVQCITFGSPRVGNKQFVELFQSLMKESYRVVDHNDPIAYVPMNYRYHHVQDALCFNDNQIKMKKDKVWYKRFFNALGNIRCMNMFHEHSMANYISLIKNR
jgi:predicted lipase